MRIVKVTASSVAEAAGLLAGDIIIELAGRRAKANTDVITVVRRQAPGTWLPLTIARNGQTVNLVARFPATLPPAHEPDTSRPGNPEKTDRDD